MREEILEFIERRWRGSEELFLNGNCYWFARILCERFPKLKLVYDTAPGHFVAYDAKNQIAYDVTGVYNLVSEPVSLLWIEFNEPGWYQRLMKDCRD